MWVQNPDLTEASMTHIVRMERAVARVSYQLDEVLDYVLPGPLNIQPCSLSSILGSVLSKIDMGEVTISLPKEDLVASMDGSKMEIVLYNLILNAVQAMEKIGRIYVRATSELDSTTIEVEDTEPGIAEHLTGKMFEPLFTTRQIGTGLGLVRCKSIVEKHGGTIKIKAKTGKGTPFIITLPDSLSTISSD